MTAKSRGFFRDNSLSLVFGVLFLITLLGQAGTGEECYRKAIELPAPKHFATHYTGPIPAPGTEFAL